MAPERRHDGAAGTPMIRIPSASKGMIPADPEVAATEPSKSAVLSIFERSNMARRRGQYKGHVFERSGWWMLRYRVDTPDLDPKTGKPVRNRITVTLARSAGTDAIVKTEARRIAREEYLSRVDVMSTRPSSMRTLREFLSQRFEPDYIATLKPTGQAFYRSILGNHVLPALGAIRLRDLSVAHVQNLLNAKLHAQRDPDTGKTKPGLSIQTSVHIRNCLSAVLRHAKAMQWYAGELPTAAVRLPEMRRKPRRALTWEQVCLLAKALPPETSALVVFLTLTGMRIGEAMGLRWRCVNLTEDFRLANGELLPPLSIAVRENFVRGRFQTLKTEKSQRNIPIPAWFVPHLWKLLAKSKYSSPDDPVFPARNGRPLDQHNIANRILRPVSLHVLNFEVSWHVFRHTNATLADQAQFSVSERQRVLGHSSAETTLHYTHSDLSKLRDRLESMVNPSLLIQ
ncbi:MAG TPA: site-specific integrase [Bryobacteraceae bacterium]|jgi:integrase